MRPPFVGDRKIYHDFASLSILASNKTKNHPRNRGWFLFG